MGRYWVLSSATKEDGCWYLGQRPHPWVQGIGIARFDFISILKYCKGYRMIDLASWYSDLHESCTSTTLQITSCHSEADWQAFQAIIFNDIPANQEQSITVKSRCDRYDCQLTSSPIIHPVFVPLFMCVGHSIAATFRLSCLAQSDMGKARSQYLDPGLQALQDCRKQFLHPISFFPCYQEGEGKIHSCCWSRPAFVVPSTWFKDQGSWLTSSLLAMCKTCIGMQAYKYEDRFLINPGSATGAYSTITPDSNPSFVLMDINGSKVSFFNQPLLPEPFREPPLSHHYIVKMQTGVDQRQSCWAFLASVFVKSFSHCKLLSEIDQLPHSLLPSAIQVLH